MNHNPTLPHPVIAGVDGSPQSTAAAHGAAAEAGRRGTHLRVVHAWGLPPLWSVDPMHSGEGERGERPVTHTVLHHAACPVAVVPHP